LERRRKNETDENKPGFKKKEESKLRDRFIFRGGGVRVW